MKGFLVGELVRLEVEGAIATIRLDRPKMNAIDAQVTAEIRAAALHGLNNLSPFEGMATRGAAVATIVRGRQMMNSIKPVDHHRVDD